MPRQEPSREHHEWHEWGFWTVVYFAARASHDVNIGRRAILTHLHT